MTPSAAKTLRYAWLIVALLWPVACLNYLDRLMITTMRDSLKADIAMTDAQFGLSLGLCALESIRGLPRGPLQPQPRHRRQFVHLVGGHLAHRPRPYL